jgi:aminoglycoside 6-adenylyltransferase
MSGIQRTLCEMCPKGDTMRKEKEIINQLYHWADSHEHIRAMLLTSSRANPNAYIDLFSDYDVELIVTETSTFGEDDTWLENFGSIIASFKDENADLDGTKSYTRLVLYDDGVRIDFQIYQVEVLLRIMREPILPSNLEIGYKVLLDKDGLTVGLKRPTHSAFIPSKPAEEEYIEHINEFWWDITYVAKSLWRDELYFAKYMLDNVIRFDYFRKVIEWYIGVQYDWTVNPNKCGRWFKRYLDPKTWSELEATFAGSSIEDNWNALFKTTDLFRRLAMEVGKHLGYTYPSEIDQRVTDYLLKIKKLDRNTDDFV